MSHEDYSREHDVDGSSDRSFGFVFAAVFLIIALWPLLSHGAPRIWALVVSGLFAVIAVLRPALLSRPNKAWMRLGLLLGKIVSPVALGIMFFTVITAIGALMRATGKDPLRLKLDRSSRSYWIERTPPGPARGSMKQQF